MELNKLTITEARQGLLHKEFSTKDLVKAVFDRIDETDDKVKAFVTTTREQALQKAEQIDEKLANGEKVGPLAGIPVAIKDNMCTKGVLTTCGSRILSNYEPPFDATVISDLEQAGAIIVGKTNMDEFAMGSSTENSAFYTTKNPWDITHVPGGSSGGSSASVAAEQVPFAIGSDTGGSIRQPAAFCGVVGFKPTYGRVSRYGLIAFASSLDQIGPLTKTVEDAAEIMNVISGKDPLDSTSVDKEVPDYTEALSKDIDDLTIGIPKEYFELVDTEVNEVVTQGLNRLKQEGGNYEEVSLPTTEYGLSAYYIIAPAEASSNLARFDGVRYGQRYSDDDLGSMYTESRNQGLGDEVKRRIMLGTYALSAGYYDAYYLKSLKVRSLIREEFEQVFSKTDVLIAPTTPTPAFQEGAQTDDPLSMYKNDICTAPTNLAGLPAITLPCGFLNGLPVGIQVIGPPFGEEQVLQVADKLEKLLKVEPKTPQQGIE